MNAKQIVSSLLFVLVAATSTATLAQGVDSDAGDRHNGAYPYTPVQVPFIE